MAKAYFNRTTGKFEIQFKDGRHFIWNGKLWTSVEGEPAWKSATFSSWYNRKGKFIRRSWAKGETKARSIDNDTPNLNVGHKKQAKRDMKVTNVLNHSSNPTSPCEAPGCDNNAVETCKYCNRRFCGYHSRPTLATNLREVSAIDPDKHTALEQEIIDSWNSKDGHVCATYSSSRRRYYASSMPYRVTNRQGVLVYDKFQAAQEENAKYISGKKTSSYRPKAFSYSKSEDLVRPVEAPIASKTEQKGSDSGPSESNAETQKVNKSILIAIVAIALVFLILYSSGYLQELITHPTMHLTTIFSNQSSLSNTSAVQSILLAKANSAFVVNAFPDNYHVVDFTIPKQALQINLSGGIDSSNTIQIILLNQSEYFNFASNSKRGFIAAYQINSTGATVSFISIFEPGEYYLVFNNPSNVNVNVTVSRKFVVTYTNSSRLKTSSTTASITTTVSPVSSSSSSTTSIVTATVNPYALDSNWADNFFRNVSLDRGEPYYYCPTLSQFANIRFKTMVANFGISHYGYQMDFQSYFGTVYNTAFEEEVLYPSGDTPSEYISTLMKNAPLHWEGLTNDTYTVFGYDLQNGPSYEIYGPDGGYVPCPVTEIPGPGINISQFFAQYGCSVVVSNLTWFVVETASSCPS